MDGQSQRVDVPAHPRTVHDDLSQTRLEDNFCWIVPYVPTMTQSVEELTWADFYQLNVSLWLNYRINFSLEPDCCKHFLSPPPEDVPSVEYTGMPSKGYPRQYRSLLLCPLSVEYYQFDLLPPSDWQMSLANQRPRGQWTKHIAVLFSKTIC